MSKRLGRGMPWKKPYNTSDYKFGNARDGRGECRVCNVKRNPRLRSTLLLTSVWTARSYLEKAIVLRDSIFSLYVVQESVVDTAIPDIY